MKFGALPVAKVGPEWIVQSDSVRTVIQIDDANNDGLIDNEEWDAFTAGTGGGIDTGTTNAVYDGDTGTSGTLYSDTVHMDGDNVTDIMDTLSNDFEADPNLFGNVVCFAKGTRILTSNGWKPIEDIAVGDEIVVRSGSTKPVRWIGTRYADLAAFQQNPKLRPVRINAGALGKELPVRDLWVSRQHRMLVQSVIANRMFGQRNVLVPAIKLTSLPGIAIDDEVREIEYLHLLFDQHEIIQAEGAPTESLFTGPEALKAMSADAREEILTIFPELGEMNYEPELNRSGFTGDC